jgi:hypothetical protein
MIMPPLILYYLQNKYQKPAKARGTAKFIDRIKDQARHGDNIISTSYIISGRYGLFRDNKTKGRIALHSGRLPHYIMREGDNFTL